MSKPKSQPSKPLKKIDPMKAPIIPEPHVFAGDMKRRRERFAKRPSKPSTKMFSTPRSCAYVDPSFYVEGEGYRASIVVEGEPGHRPTGTWPYTGAPGETRPWFWGPTFEDAQAMAERHNKNLGISKREAHKIVSSSFRASELRKPAARKPFSREDAENILNLLADAEEPIKSLLAERGHPDTSHSDVCDALRTFADGEIDLHQ